MEKALSTYFPFLLFIFLSFCLFVCLFVILIYLLPFLYDGSYLGPSARGISVARF